MLKQLKTVNDEGRKYFYYGIIVSIVGIPISITPGDKTKRYCLLTAQLLPGLKVQAHRSGYKKQFLQSPQDPLDSQ